MADLNLITPPPQPTKLRTHQVSVTIGYKLVNGSGQVVGKKSLQINSDDEGLSPAQRNAIINFATSAAQIAGLIP